MATASPMSTSALYRSLPLVRPSPASEAPGTRRPDGRTLDEFRPVLLRTGVVGKAAGSSCVELRETKVVCSVFGPHASESRDYLGAGGSCFNKDLMR